MEVNGEAADFHAWVEQMLSSASRLKNMEIYLRDFLMESENSR